VLTGTFINVGTVLAGTAVGSAAGDRLPSGVQQRVLSGLGLVVLLIGVDLGLAWRHASALPVEVLGGVMLGGLAGEALRIEDRLAALGDRLQALSARGRAHHSHLSEAFFTASLLFCVGPLTVVGAIEDGLHGRYQALATKALLDGFAAIALSSTLGPGVAFAALTVLVVQGGISLGAGLFEHVLPDGSDALAALTSAGGILIVGIALRLLDLKDVKVGNYLPALVFAPAIVGIVSAL
jgi:uncharacterized protein